MTLSLQTLIIVEKLLLSRNDPLWGEFMVLAKTLADVQYAKTALEAAQAKQQPSLKAVPDVPEPPKAA